MMAILIHQDDNRIKSSSGKSKGSRVPGDKIYHVMTNDLPEDINAFLACVDDAEYELIIEPIDSIMSEVTLIPDNKDAPKNGAWLRDDD